ncbi:MAG: D-tyrosyl-tRNA(Tyr) deacylase [Erysipelothrix sp.]|nr:D-tyrosyl-tRNA(Tyr) deacylase [Erysipelothrix sp.]
MKIVVQRVKSASVKVNSEIVSSIDHGLLLLVGFEKNDTMSDVLKLAKKVVSLRIFDDEDGKMNLSVQQVGGAILSVSQFTLAALTKKGNRPSFIEAMEPQLAQKYFETFNEEVKKLGIEVKSGVFQAHMDVSLVNDGPVTILLEGS